MNWKIPAAIAVLDAAVLLIPETRAAVWNSTQMLFDLMAQNPGFAVLCACLGGLAVVLLAWQLRPKVRVVDIFDAAGYQPYMVSCSDVEAAKEEIPGCKADEGFCSYCGTKLVGVHCSHCGAPRRKQ